MSKLYLGFIFGFCIIFSVNCGTGSENKAANSNSVNENNAANKPENSDSANINTANTITPGSEEVPEYTGAATALEEGNKFLDNSENAKAINAFEQSVKLDPELAEAHFRLGVALALTEKETEETAPPDAEETPEKTKKKKQNKKDDSEKTPSQKAFQNAVKAYENIIKKDPKDDQAFFYLARSYGKINEDQDALKAMQTAVKLKPEDGDYQTELGEIYINLAQYDEAVRALKKALEIDENNLIAEDLLEQAQAGKKRVDFGANMIKQKVKVEKEP